MNSKLERQLAELLDADIINADTAQKITAFYHTKEQSKPNRLFTIFGVLGALLSGLGIILIIAHNWDDMPRNIKTAIAFLPLAIGQITSAYSLIKNKSAAWVESSLYPSSPSRRSKTSPASRGVHSSRPAPCFPRVQLQKILF